MGVGVGAGIVVVMRRALLALALVVATLTAAACGGLGGDTAQALLPTNKRTVAPAFSQPALNGGGTISLAQHRGRPVLLNFWASWCPPCRHEMPDLVAFAKAHPKLDVVGLAVTDVPSDSRSFAKKVGATFPLGIDRSGSAASDFGVVGLPTTVIIDPQGRVAATVAGPLRGNELEGFAKELGV